MSKPISNIVVGISRKATCLLFLRHPAYRRRESIIGIYMERENLSSRWQEKRSSSGHYKTERIEAWHGGGMSRSSEEASVMEAEQWSILRNSGCTLEQLARMINPVLKGWINYYGRFYKTTLRNFLQVVNVKIARWARRKYKGLRASDKKAIRWLYGISQRSPNLFAHWSIGSKPTLKTTGAV
jgi:hypothetical protein